jgi:putative ABC transport system permease protein
MKRAVPLGRRNLFQDRRRAGLSVAGVSVALLLVLMLDGIFAGAMRQVTTYIERSPADVFVSQAGVRTMHMSSSSMPPAMLQEVQAVPGTAWTEAVRFASSVVVRAGTARQLSYVIGYEPQAGRGGPERIVTGRAPNRGEAVIDQVGASELGIGLGDELRIGAVFRVSGLSSDGTSIANTTTFVTSADFADMRGGAIAFVLAGAVPGVEAADLANRIQAALPSTTVQTRIEFADQERRIVRDMSADVMVVMTVIGFFIALAVVGLTLFTATLSKMREFGVVKALGARPHRLVGMVLGQAAWLVGSAVILAVGLALMAGVGVAVLTPHVRIAVELSSIGRAAVGALVVGLIGSLVPLVRVLRVDPASVFRGM